MTRTQTLPAIAVAAALAVLPIAAQAQSWTKLKAKTPFTAGAMLLMNDGTVMTQDQGTCGCGGGNWWKLTPDKTGSYVNGSWSQVATMPSGYAPLYFASQVLPDGRLIVQGGEYNGSGNGVWTTKGALYDPAKNSWTSVAPPKGWTSIGDAQSTLLEDGTYMLANCCNLDEATLDLSTMTYTSIGAGKADINDEEGWTLLPTGQVLSADANDSADPKHTEVMSTKGKWTSAGDSPVLLADLGTSTNSHELGPQVLRPDGTVFVGGATNFNAVYTVKTGKWTQAPNYPKGVDQADAPGAILPSGNVLLAASPGVFNSPTTFYEFDGTKLNSVPAIPNASGDPSFVVRFVVLPSGQIMATDGSSDVEFYNSTGAPNPSWAPVIGTFPSTVAAGKSYKLKGTYLAGFSNGAAYGDDYQSDTNRPMVEITNTASGDVQFATISGLSSYKPQNPKPVKVTVTLPKSIETGASTLTVVTNGIPSKPMNISVQ